MIFHETILLYLLLLVLTVFTTRGQNIEVDSLKRLLVRTEFQLDSLLPQGILLDKGWKWYAGNNL
ncbi:MAG: hypothetical protein LH606_20215 [Cytophagaceae bacterium]|nr:hypothetical protein [Cytophagaceae bacterium]